MVSFLPRFVSAWSSADMSIDSNWQGRDNYRKRPEEIKLWGPDLTRDKTNDGNTMLRDMAVMHPAAKMLVDLANAQDIEAGDGTTSVVVIAGSLLGAAERLLAKGIHPTIISESFQRAAAHAVKVLHDISVPIQLTDRATLLKAASTSLSSKIVSQEPKLAPMAVDSVLKTIDPRTADNVDLRNIRILKKVGGVIDDSEMVDGLVLQQPVVKSGGGPTRIEKARIGLIQFQLSPPKPDVSSGAWH